MDVRVLHSFPHKIGSGRIADTAWYEAAGAAAAGIELTVFPGVVHRALPDEIEVAPTLARGRWRIPYKSLGRLRALALHDRIVARRLERIAARIDVVHVWPLGALHTLRTARRLGIPTVLERPNCHTRYAYESVQRECERLGVELPGRHEHAYNAVYLRKEEEEYRLADLLLCPSDFVAQTFVSEGFASEKLVRHMYGYDPANFYPRSAPRAPGGLRALFVGVAAVRKGVHFALEAWLASPVSESGVFRIAGEFLPAYSRRLETMLAHPSVEVLGHRTDVAELMRESDVLLLPSIEEGSALVVGEALASGAVPLVSEATSGVTLNEVNSLVHAVGDVPELTRHLTALSESPELLERLRLGALRTAPDYTWDRAGIRLADIYREAAVAADSQVAFPSRLTA